MICCACIKPKSTKISPVRTEQHYPSLTLGCHRHLRERRAKTSHSPIGLLRTEISSMARIAPDTKVPEFDPNIFLATIGDGRKFLAVLKKQRIYTQGDRA